MINHFPDGPDIRYSKHFEMTVDTTFNDIESLKNLSSAFKIECEVLEKHNIQTHICASGLLKRPSIQVASQLSFALVAITWSCGNY